MSLNGDGKERGNYSLVDINKEMRESYLQYSMSVIVGRALPDVRDGLKPVHRRILFAMKDLNNTHDKPYKKSARVVGDVIGKYHPHGEMAVYDSIVRMAQDFSMRTPLIDGQGNFGSIDGDSAAASRYTEIRMTAIAEELLTDIDKQTVPFGPNYDDTLLIPHVLPARFPNLLVNGSAGIAVGMSCNIPPHNLGEVIEACLYVLENKQATVEELMQIVPGPDFPTAGIVEGRGALIAAYTKGRGIITLSSVTDIEETDKNTQIVITEIPYQVNKARLIESIASLVKDKKVEGISDIRDESSREGLRIVIPVKRSANASVILNQLQKHTQLRTSFGIIFLALDKNNQPRTFSLKQILDTFIEHRKEVISHRLIFDLKKAQEKLHILEGLEKALNNIDQVIKIVRGSKEGSEARMKLISELDFSHRQAQAILEMRLQKLTGLERESLKKDRIETQERAKSLKEILSSDQKIEGLVKEELIEIKQKYATPRKTEIQAGSGDIEDRDLIESKDVVLFLTFKGLVKRIPLEEYRLQKRGGKGLKGWELKTEGDFVWNVWSTNTLDRLLVFSNLGRLHWLDVYKIPSGMRQTKARSLNNLLTFKENAEPRLVLPLKEEEDKDKSYIITITKKGTIKKTKLSLFSRPRAGGVNAVGVDEGDSLQDVLLCGEEEDVIIYTKNGKATRISSKSVKPTGRSARGVRGIKLKGNDEVVSLEILKKDETGEILVITEKGYGKRVKASEFRKQGRGGQGVLGQKITDKTGGVVCAKLGSGNQQVLVSTNQGQSIRFSISGVSTFGRVSQGVRFINLKANEKVTGFTLIDEEHTEEGEEESSRVVNVSQEEIEKAREEEKETAKEVKEEEKTDTDSDD